MKNIIKSIILITLLIISTSCKSTSNKELNYDNFDLAIMIESEKEASKYEKYEGIDWPDKEDYTLNTALSTCKNNNTIEWDEEKGTIYLTSNKWDKCIAKFDKIIKIEYIEDLVDLSNRVNGGDSLKGKTVKLMRDLDFNNSDNDYKNSQNTQYGDFNQDGKGGLTIFQELTGQDGAGFMPIGTKDSPFEGNFDGNSHTLSNLYINSSSDNNKGFFGAIKTSIIKDLSISGEVKVTKIDSGSIAGRAENSSIINLESYINISSSIGSNSLGGILGYAKFTTIDNCINHGKVTNSNNTGGLVGIVAADGELLIKNSHNKGTITNNLGSHAGGLVGRDNAATSTINIKNSHNEGEIKVNKGENITNITYVGGLIGKVNGTANIENSNNVGKIEFSSFGAIKAGGLVGDVGKKAYVFKAYNKGNINNLKEEYLNKTNIGIYVSGIANGSASTDSILLEECYNTGILSGGNRMGGLLAPTSTTGEIIINKCYNKGNIINGPDTGVYNSNLAGLVSLFQGDNKIVILNSYNIGDIYNSRGLDAVAGLITTNYYPKVSIINCYNLGNNISPLGIASGIFINFGNNYEGTRKYEKYFYIDNVYNANILTKFQYSIVNLIRNYEYKIRNAFYYNNSSSSQNISDKTDNNIVSKELEEIKSQAFVDTLNKNIESINIKEIDEDLEGYMLSKWVLGSDGYPTLEGVGN